MAMTVSPDVVPLLLPPQPTTFRVIYFQNPIVLGTEKTQKQN